MRESRNNKIDKPINQTVLVFGNIRVKENFFLCMSIALYYAFAVLTRVQSSVFQGSTVLATIIRFGTYGIILLILLGLIGNTRRLAILLVLEALTGIIFLLSVSTGNIGSLNWQNIYQLIATTYIPLAMAAYYITDRKLLMKMLYFVAVVSVPILIAISIMTYGNWEHSYDMSLGYVMVFSALVLIAQFTIDSKIYNILLAALLSLFILFVGSRGPFICIMAFGILELLLSKRYTPKKKMAIIIIICIAVWTIWVNLDNLLMLIYRQSVNLGFNSRSLLLLMEGEAVSHDSGRGVLQEYYTQLIQRKPVLGYGVMGRWISDETYPHNIVLEFLLSYGYLVGIPLLLALLYIFVKGVKAKNTKYNNALIVLFVSYCMHLFVSGTYLKVWQFFVCIALCLPNRMIMNHYDE